jgi:two-component system KDP operon response regulator KdpE
VVDDEPQTRRWLQVNLEKNGYTVTTAATGGQALEQLTSRPPDVAIIDLLLPDTDGLELTRRLRSRSGVPIIIVSAIHDEPKKVEALGLGADDYVTKPFGVPELVARIKSVMRRAMGLQSTELSLACGELSIHFERREVRVRGELVKLTPTEYELLKHLAVNVGRVLTQRAILTAVWGPAYSDQGHYLRMYVKKLRGKIESDPSHPRYIRTEAGVGYWLCGDERPPQEDAAAVD